MIMKKEYISPKCSVSMVETQQMLAVRLDVDNTPGNDMTGDVNINSGFTDIWGNEF